MSSLESVSRVFPVRGLDRRPPALLPASPQIKRPKLLLPSAAFLRLTTEWKSWLYLGLGALLGYFGDVWVCLYVRVWESVDFRLSWPTWLCLVSWIIGSSLFVCAVYTVSDTTPEQDLTIHTIDSSPLSDGNVTLSRRYAVTTKSTTAKCSHCLWGFKSGLNTAALLVAQREDLSGQWGASC